MNADREPNRLPLRAGAMMLLAVAIVCIGLGWHSVVTGDDDPESDLEAAGRNSPAATSAPVQTSTAAPTSASADTPELCVYNAGSVSGLAGEITTELEDAGFPVDEPGNLSTSSITENTIFYDTGDKAAAEKVAEALGGDYSVERRPSSFTRCASGMPVIVVTR